MIMPINLPDDIVVYVLLKLPAKSICKFRCVCKYWYNNLFKDPYFINNRLEHSIESERLNCFSIKNGDAPEFYMHNITKDGRCEYVKMQDSPFKDCQMVNPKDCQILGSCNGLILMSPKEYQTTNRWLWNPYTKEFKEVIIPKIRDGPVYSVAYGIGYNCDTDDYVIVVANFYSSLRGYEVQVYTLRSNSCKTLPNVLPYFILSAYYGVEAIYVRGSIHWIATRCQSKGTCIVSYDIRGENFKEVAVTQRVDELLSDLNDNEKKSLGVLGGCLCLLRPYGGYNIEVYVKNDYNVTESWTTLFIVQLPVVSNPIHHVKLLWEFKNGEVLFVASKGSRPWNSCFVLYDLVSQKCKVSEIHHIPTYRWNIEAYVERSVVSPINSTSTQGRVQQQDAQCTTRTKNINTFGE